MTPKLSNIEGVRKALRESHGQAVEIEDDQKVYIIVARDQFRDMQHRTIRDRDWSEMEMMACCSRAE